MNFHKERKLIIIFKYILIGILNNITGFSVFKIFFNIFKFNIFSSGTLGFASGAIISYLFNSKWTFKTRRRSKKQFIFFILIQILIINLFSIILIIVNNYIFDNPNISWLFSVLFVTAINFFMQQKLFKQLI